MVKKMSLVWAITLLAALSLAWLKVIFVPATCNTTATPAGDAARKGEAPGLNNAARSARDMPSRARPPARLSAQVSSETADDRDL